MPNEQKSPPPLPSSVKRFAFAAMPDDPGPLLILETLLKTPGRILFELSETGRLADALWLLAFGLVAMALYGVVVGSLAGGIQLLIAPAKLVLGTVLAVALCLPSLYIFSCLAGMEARLRTIAGVMLAAVCVASLLLVGFAPVAWIFSQSTDSIPLMGTLHLLFWGIGVLFGLRLIGAMARQFEASEAGHLKIWSFIFILVCLQMTTALRPIIGRSDHFLPREKKFFLTHWADSLQARAETAH
jgi:hypothetical protein